MDPKHSQSTVVSSTDLVTETESAIQPFNETNTGAFRLTVNEYLSQNMMRALAGWQKERRLQLLMLNIERNMEGCTRKSLMSYGAAPNMG
jgi:hypothetical protein